MRIGPRALAPVLRLFASGLVGIAFHVLKKAAENLSVRFTQDQLLQLVHTPVSELKKKLKNLPLSAEPDNNTPERLTCTCY